MDAAIAGLIGALGGGALGAAGAWGAAVIAFRGARYQADQQRDGAHDQWLRQVRRETYARFLAAADAMATAVGTTPLPEGVSEELVVAEQLMRLEAPELIAEKAARLNEEIGRLMRRRREQREFDVRAFASYDRTRRELETMCRKSLTGRQAAAPDPM